MIIWAFDTEIEAGATALLHDVEAETLQITRFRKVGCKNPTKFAGLRTAPATYHAKNTANTTFPCGMLQNTGFGTIPWGREVGGGSEPRTGIIYVCINIHIYHIYIYIYMYIFNIYEYRIDMYVCKCVRAYIYIYTKIVIERDMCVIIIIYN